MLFAPDGLLGKTQPQLKKLEITKSQSGSVDLSPFLHIQELTWVAYHDSQVPVLKDVLRDNKPCLKIIDLMGYPTADHDRNIEELFDLPRSTAIGHWFPRLERLAIYGCWGPDSFPSLKNGFRFGNLKYLRLANSTRIGGFLNALAECGALEQLALLKWTRERSDANSNLSHVAHRQLLNLLPRLQALQQLDTDSYSTTELCAVLDDLPSYPSLQCLDILCEHDGFDLGTLSCQAVPDDHSHFTEDEMVGFQFEALRFVATSRTDDPIAPLSPTALGITGRLAHMVRDTLYFY